MVLPVVAAVAPAEALEQETLQVPGAKERLADSSAERRTQTGH